MNYSSIKQKKQYYCIKFGMLKRRINPHNFPSIFKVLDIFKKPSAVYSLAIITIFMMLCIILSKIDLLNPKIIAFNEVKEIQAQLLAASSIIVSLLIAYVISKYFDIQNFRKTELNKFIKLQNRLVQYLNVFYHLGDQLERKYHLKPKYPLDHKKALRDEEYCYNPANRTEKPDACIFTSTLREAGSQSSFFDNYEINRKIMPKGYLKKLESCLSYLSGVLDREKYYKFVLEDLGINEIFWHSDCFSIIKIAENTLFIEKMSLGISPKDERSDWENLEFWRNRIDEAHIILIKMLKLSNYLHDYRANLIRRLLLPLVIISIFGIILPLILLSIQFNEDFEYYLTYMSIAGFLIFFIYIISCVYSELTSVDIQRL